MGEFENVSITQVKEFWDRRPCNLRHSPAPVGSRQYFDQVEQRKYHVEPHIPGFAQFERWNGKRVLEIGCGIGTDGINFARAGARVTELDLSTKSLELCRQRFEVFGLDAEFYAGDAEHLDAFLPKQEFDLVYSFGVIHHTPRPRKVIEQVLNVLHPDGELRIMVYSKFSYKLFWIMRETGNWDFSRMDELIAEYSEAQTGCPVTHTYTFAEARDLLDGFEIVEIRKAHIFPYEVEAYKNYEYVVEPCWRDVTPDRFAQLEAELGWHTLVRARLANGKPG